MSTDTFHCIDCGQDKPVKHDGGTGYGSTDQGKVCYACCVERDKREMRERGKITLYLTHKRERDNPIACAVQCRYRPHWRVINGPATLEISIHSVRHSRGYGFGRYYPVTNVQFDFEGQRWTGRNAGDNQILRARRIKA